MDKQSPEQQAALEAGLRSMSWKALVRALKESVEEHHRPIELPSMIRRWLEVNRGTPKTPDEATHIEREVKAIKWWVDAKGDSARWFENKSENAPISGWIVTASHALRDGVRWWLFAARRHDDNAALVGPTVPAPAIDADLKKLGKIIAYAGGNPKRELLVTGAITKEEHDEFIAEGNVDIAEYGQIFYWWRA